MPHQLNIGNDFEGGARKFADHSGSRNGGGGGGFGGGSFRRFDGGRGGSHQRFGRDGPNRGGLSQINWKEVLSVIL